MKAASAHTLAPTFILNVTDDTKIMQEEIFGPVLPIKTYHSLDEAIAYVNSHPRPLALYYFGHDDDDRRKVLSRTTSGNVTVNGSLTHYAQEDLPFGGVGPSGIGAYHGRQDSWIVPAITRCARVSRTVSSLMPSAPKT
ncbi:acyl-CoA reductase-like NAD-dependent aldehyde dehydrogenase [Kerstersia gyiorum]|nr:acyl-CoA reductase-like NAD-dependent aldehyde dehydrogenase [Kerstersia gyiorum]MCP1678669.1 acyl-CoA reductase-like NAD-dependent aldehyde dehydrogenase [Kerstersia gyiorum]MCP1683332.1 acyl-CoA reductase-like NAD-dependent aldehyde dehydrogenase [Kerstersia gyiorum]MCP1713470.1 acyl-CoA reductase-like NAD-dependent aldehyde dehydrogenase [Kerstersia gyiorum]MCP1719002.1 acyl-CoA reductase-like NAD-dependent aldehyde dehydrogenase [Kerstersia gyiorum]